MKGSYLGQLHFGLPEDDYESMNEIMNLMFETAVAVGEHILGHGFAGGPLYNTAQK